MRLHTVGVSMERRNSKARSASVSAMACRFLPVVTSFFPQPDPLGQATEALSEAGEFRQGLRTIENARIEILLLQLRHDVGVVADGLIELGDALSELGQNGAQEGEIFTADLQHVVATDFERLDGSVRADAGGARQIGEDADFPDEGAAGHSTKLNLALRGFDEYFGLPLGDQQDRIAGGVLTQEQFALRELKEIAANDERLEVLLRQCPEGPMLAQQMQIGGDVADDGSLLRHASPLSCVRPSHLAQRHFRPVSAARPRSRSPISAACRASALGFSSRALR